jgi:hypothetical protein
MAHYWSDVGQVTIDNVIQKNKKQKQNKTIDILPEDTLLDIFDIYVDEAGAVGGWYSLVHVCRRWRYLVFASPRRLDLRLLCTEKTPASEMLDVWPAFPIFILGHGYSTSPVGADNIVAAFERHNRVCHISLSGVLTSLLERIGTVTEEPFPQLTHLELLLYDKRVPALPDTFLGGSTPRLQTLTLDGIPLSPLQTMLLSATDLVHLHLWNIPHSGYLSPDAMVTCLSELIMLQSFRLGFRSHLSFPDSTTPRSPPLIRAVLPVLTSFEFYGVSEYLEDLVAQIGASLLHSVKITLFSQIVLGMSHLSEFLGRIQKFKALKQADVLFHRHTVAITLTPQKLEGRADDTTLALRTSCRLSEWQLDFLVQTFSPSLTLLSTLECLDIREDRYSRPNWQDDMENAQWLEFLRPFTAVKNLHLSSKLALLVAPALQELGNATEVLPALQDIFLEGPQPPGLEQFVADRQLSGHPVAVHR